jgi:putative FmdB family regulatory protein
MPIYAYKCASCGAAKDVLQKISDPVLTDCPACGKATFQKQITAAGFQLKGSGWYATDFKGGSTSTSAGTSDSAPAATSSEAPSASSAPAAGHGCSSDCACD